MSEVKIKFQEENLIILKHEYDSNGTLAALVYTEEGEPYSDLSTNIGSPKQGDDTIFVKMGCVEEEIASVLVKKGLLEPTEELGKSGFNTYRLYRVKF